MEAFLRNVPQDLSDTTLRKELEPVMKALAISDWQCDKPRRKDLAWVSFLRAADGNKFLQKHGATTSKVPQPSPNTLTPAQTSAKPHVGPQAKPVGQSPSQLFAPKLRSIARLHITGKPVFAEISRRPVRKHMLSHLKHEQTQRLQTPQRNPAAPVIEVTSTSLHCGHNIFHSTTEQLLFVQQTELNIQTTIRLTEQSMSIVLTNCFRIDISTETIMAFIISDSSWTTVLSEPPRFYGMINQDKDTFTKWERRESCPGWPDHANYAAGCLVYQFRIAHRNMDQLTQTIKDRDLIPVTKDQLPMEQHPEPNVDDYTTSIAAFDAKINDTRRRAYRLPFSTLFQIQVLVWNNYLHPSKATRMIDMMELIATELKDQGAPFPFTVDSMKKLFLHIPYPCPWTDPSELDLHRLVKKVIEVDRDFRRADPMRQELYGAPIPNHQAYVMKASVTPTRITLSGPEAESKNRILRMFPNYTDYFLRVLFCDDDGQDLSFNPKVSNDKVYARYRQVLRDGIKVGGRHFSFLGFSHSSLRSHSAWFMAPFTDHNFQKQSYDTVIRSLGNFSEIKVPAKCAARIGQAFSETAYAVPIFELNVQNRYIPDVKSSDGERVFSDGCGTLSTEAMNEFWGHLPERYKAATCFQIRWGGAKGMLSLDTRLKGKTFCIRKESMVKFQSSDVEEVGICDGASKPLRLMLNRQMIKILEDMGTANDWFFKLQNRELTVLRMVTDQAGNTSTFMRHQLIGTSMGFPQFIRQVDRMGIDYRRDVFLKTVVEHVVLKELRLVKHKARIPVYNGVTLFGIMDETGFLGEDEIYVTFDKSNKQIARPPEEGPAIVTRSPALHPGDVRVARMVSPPENSPLLHLQNCIVFSQKGDRDLPSQLSGGDLDGDLYNIIWDTEAMPMRMFHPADYPRVSPEPLNREVTRDDIADFFINFMKTDVLGMIATRHVIMADHQDGGTRDLDCIKLAGLHSTAVDSSKTGIPVNVQDLPRAPKTRPDFLAPAPPLKLYDIGQVAHIEDLQHPDEDDALASRQHRYHRSEKILGKLYRAVDENKIWTQDISKTIDMTGPTIWEQLLDLVLREIANLGLDLRPQTQHEEAWRIRNLYDGTVEDKMWEFSDNPRVPLTEVEVFIGFILNKRGSQTRRQRDSSIKLKDETDRVMAWIVSMIRERGETATNEDVVELCLACVQVGCAKNTEGVEGYSANGNLQSFKVLAGCCLLREITALSRAVEVESGGGYVGVGGAGAGVGGQGKITLPFRAK